MHNPDYKNHRSGKVWIGIIFLLVGCLLLIRTLGFFMPDWIISWPMLLIVIGVLQGFKHNFRHPGPLITILVGVVFLSERVFPDISFREYVWPFVIIGVGLFMIFGKSRRCGYPNHFRNNWNRRESWNWDKRVRNEDDEPTATNSSFNPDDTFSKEDYLDIVSIFGGQKKNIVSKKFRGGEIVTIMGGAELNFMQADINGKVMLDVTQVFGGTKIVVPSHWQVSSEVAAIFGGVEDKRTIVSESSDTTKVLIIKGTSIFGGIEIRSY